MEQGTGELTSCDTEEDYVDGGASSPAAEAGAPEGRVPSAQTLCPTGRGGGSLYHSHFCPLCPAVFMLPRSLTSHLSALHPLPLPPSTVDVETGEVTVQSPSEHSPCPHGGRRDRRDNSSAASPPSSLKLQPAAPMEEEEEGGRVGDECSLTLPSPPLCPHCLLPFLLPSSLLLHLALCHGQSLQELLPLHCWSRAGNRLVECGNSWNTRNTTNSNSSSNTSNSSINTNNNTNTNTNTNTTTNNKKTTEKKQQRPKKAEASIDTAPPPQAAKALKAKQHACEDCGRAFVLKGDLKRHRMTHSGLRPFPCPLCPKAFSRAGHLREHTRVHTGERPYPCPHCPKRFAHATNLHNHTLTHTGERPHQCGECGARFSERNHLKQHRRTHTGERPYVCGECGKGFALSFDLKRHGRLHSGERPHVCPLCPAVAFRQARSLKRHRRNVHGDMGGGERRC